MEALWQVVGATAPGVSHLRQGLPCQDALSYRSLPDGVLLIAVADGAGTAEHSDQGAQRAVEAALDLLAGRLQGDLPAECCAWHELIWEAFESSYTALQQLADESDAPRRAFATTLTCVIATPQRLVVGQLGDGALVAKDGAGELSTITRFQRGEYANETNFLTQDAALEQVEIQIIEEDFAALAVMSDGLTRLALKRPSDEPHLPFFQPLFAFVEAAASNGNGALANDELAAFLASPRVCERTDDDKALALAVRRATGE